MAKSPLPSVEFTAKFMAWLADLHQAAVSRNDFPTIFPVFYVCHPPSLKGFRCTISSGDDAFESVVEIIITIITSD
jgi:hypothetical protein